MIDYTDVKASLIAEWRSLGGTIEARAEIANEHLRQYKAFRLDVRLLKKQRRTCETALRALGESAFDKAVLGDIAAIDSNRENER